MHARRSSGRKDTLRINGSPARRLSTACNGSTTKWHWKDATTISRLRSFVKKPIILRPRCDYSRPCLLHKNNSFIQMAEHLKRSEAEINELLAEYWKLRHETGV